ncbi:MAG: hypothetical protein U0X86_000884 [Wolbachia endosymbiont of Xenopsylla cheopis]
MIDFNNNKKYAAGQRSDYIKALDLISGKRMEVLITDKGCDANYMIEAAKAVNAEPVIPISFQ